MSVDRNAWYCKQCKKYNGGGCKHCSNPDLRIEKVNEAVKRCILACDRAEAIKSPRLDDIMLITEICRKLAHKIAVEELEIVKPTEQCADFAEFLITWK
jgi:hypothetical protein